MARRIRKSIMLRIGPIAAPVSLYGAVDTKSTKSRRSWTTTCVNGHGATGVKRKYVCPSCGSDDEDTFVRSATVDDKLVPVAQTAIDAAGPPEELKNSLSLTSHPRADVDTTTLPSGSVYYLAPDDGAADVYALMLALVAASPDTVFVCEFVTKSVPSMYRLDTHAGALTLVQLARPDDVRDTPEFDVPDVNDGTLEMLQTLVGQLQRPFDPDDYRDEQAERIDALVAATAAGEAPSPDTVTSITKPTASIADVLAAALGEAA